MGADNLRGFHRWQKWREIAHLVPIAVVDRVGPSLYANGSIAAQALSRFRIRRGRADAAARRPPAWVFLHGLKSPLSSTALRALRRKRADPEKRIGFGKVIAINMCHIKVAECREIDIAVQRRKG